MRTRRAVRAGLGAMALALVALLPVAGDAVAKQPAGGSVAEPVLSAEEHPVVGRLVEVSQGDLMCYADILTPDGRTQYGLPASFALCDTGPRHFDLAVRLLYAFQTVADCESAEPCGRTHGLFLIDGVRVLGPGWQHFESPEVRVTLTDGSASGGAILCDWTEDCLFVRDGTRTCQEGRCTHRWYREAEDADIVFVTGLDAGDGGPALLSVEERRGARFDFPGLARIAGDRLK